MTCSDERPEPLVIQKVWADSMDLPAIFFDKEECRKFIGFMDSDIEPIEALIVIGEQAHRADVVDRWLPPDLKFSQDCMDELGEMGIGTVFKGDDIVFDDRKTGEELDRINRTSKDWDGTFRLIREWIDRRKGEENG